MNDEIKISVIIPLFNKESSINSTIDSILKQTFTQFELLIINDGSTDKSLKSISKFNDERITIFTKENSGVSDSRNYGIKKSKTDLIFFIDADDLIKKDCLSTLFNLTVQYPNESIFCGNFEILNSKGIIIPSRCKLNTKSLVTRPIKELWLDNIFLRTGNTLIHKRCLNEIGGFNPQLSYFEDMDLILNMIREYNVVYDPKVIFSYLLEYNNLSSKNVLINKDWACSVNFKAKPNYEKLIIGGIVYSSFIKRYRNRDYSGCYFTLKKHFLYLHYILISKILKKYFRN